MDLNSTVEAIWNAHRAGDHFPQDWLGKLDLREGYSVQSGIRQRHLGQGAAQAGWKVGLTADPVREMFGATAPVYGYLLAANGHPSGHTFQHAEIPKPALESEIMLVLAEDLCGPNLTPEQARAAVKEVIPAFEIISHRGGDVATDMALALADNVLQAAFVMGNAIPFTSDIELADETAEVTANGGVKATALCRDVMDHPMASLAWLANTLHDNGLSLSAGDRILTGSFNKPFPINAGDQLETRFSGLGSVSASFV